MLLLLLELISLPWRQNKSRQKGDKNSKERTIRVGVRHPAPAPLGVLQEAGARAAVCVLGGAGQCAGWAQTLRGGCPALSPGTAPGTSTGCP